LKILACAEKMGMKAPIPTEHGVPFTHNGHAPLLYESQYHCCVAASTNVSGKEDMKHAQVKVPAVLCIVLFMSPRSRTLTGREL
jgi:hypothetical protein